MAERSSAWEIVIPVEAEGFSVTAYIDVVFMTRSNALAIVLFSDVFEPFDEQMREQLAGLVQMRMTDAVEML
jgi:hypothetical protein